MATALTVEQFLDRKNLSYDIVAHDHTSTSLQTAKASGIAPPQLAKAVLLKDEGRYVMAVLPSARHLRLGEMRRTYGRDFGMAIESEVARIFADCSPGAAPALGPAYGLETIWDDSLANVPDVYFEAGDHEHLVHMRTEDYLRAFGDCFHGAFSEPV